MTTTQEPVALRADNDKVLALIGTTPDGTGVRQVTSWQQARGLAGDRGLTYQLAEIEAVFGVEE